MRKRLIFYVIIAFLLCTNLALAALVRVVSEEGNTKTGDFVFSGRRGPDTLTLQEIAADAKDDDEILLKVTDYYAANRERLGLLWGEENPTRLAALFTMYVTHISTVYGEAVMPTTLVRLPAPAPRALRQLYVGADAAGTGVRTRPAGGGFQRRTCVAGNSGRRAVGTVRRDD